MTIPPHANGPSANDRSSSRVLITGGAGFIGSHLAEAFLARGHQVTVIDNLSTGSEGNIDHLRANPQFRFVKGTVTDEADMKSASQGVDTIFHLAAAVGVRLIVEHPVNTIETNVRGTEVVLRVASQQRAKVLLASTSEVYGKGNGIPFREDDDVVLGPTCRSRWSYAASKMVDEFLALAYQRERATPVIVCRLFNTVGPRQTGKYGMVIPRFVMQAMTCEPITVYGDGNQRRCFCHVDDVVEAMIGLAESPQALGGVFNIGSTEETSINELALLVKELTRSSSEIVHIPYSEAYAPGFEDMTRRIPDISKIQELIGWGPRLGITDILLSVTREVHREAAIQSGDVSI